MSQLKLPQLIAHRGARNYAPENTCAAMQKAKLLGAGWVEFDVMLSADGVPIVMHDEKVNRTTNGRGRVGDMTFAKLKKLDAGSWFAAEFTGETIPSLLEMLDCLQQHKLKANLEIKPYPMQDEQTARAVVDIIQHQWPDGLCLPLVSSFSWPALLVVNELAPNLQLGLLLDSWDENWQQRADQISAVSVHVNHRQLTQSRIAEIKATGRLALAYTVNRASRAHKLFSWGLDAIFTDDLLLL